MADAGAVAATSAVVSEALVGRRPIGPETLANAVEATDRQRAAVATGALWLPWTAPRPTWSRPTAPRPRRGRGRVQSLAKPPTWFAPHGRRCGWSACMRPRSHLDPWQGERFVRDLDEQLVGVAASL